MTYEKILSEIEKIVKEIARSKGMPITDVTAKTELLSGGLPIDSLDLAGIVLRLEDATGYDPFKEGFIDFRTAGELARLYER
jgi:acyl carrier protein